MPPRDKYLRDEDNPAAEEMDAARDRFLGIPAKGPNQAGDKDQAMDFRLDFGPEDEPDEGRDFAKRKKRGEPAVASTRLRNY